MIGVYLTIFILLIFIGMYIIPTTNPNTSTNTTIPTTATTTTTTTTTTLIPTTLIPTTTTTSIPTTTPYVRYVKQLLQTKNIIKPTPVLVLEPISSNDLTTSSLPVSLNTVSTNAYIKVIPQDLGYEEFTRGYYDIQNTGDCNDYCRYVGDPDNLFFSCALANPNGTSFPINEYTENGLYTENGIINKKCENTNPTTTPYTRYVKTITPTTTPIPTTTTPIPTTTTPIPTTTPPISTTTTSIPTTTPILTTTPIPTTRYIKKII